MITVYECCWAEKRFVFGRSEEEVRETLVRRCFAYGEPEDEDEAAYMLGTKWAEAGVSDGWRIESRTVEVLKLEGSLFGSFEKNELVHLYWQCPRCHYKWGEDIEIDDEFPRLVFCGHKKNSDLEESFYLVDVPGK